MEQALRGQYRQHPSWTYQLHYDNLLALAESHPGLGPVPSCATIARFMKGHGLFKQRRRKRRQGGTQESFSYREVRSFEVEHVHALWHADFHTGSRRVLLPSGEWAPCYSSVVHLVSKGSGQDILVDRAALLEMLKDYDRHLSVVGVAPGCTWHLSSLNALDNRIGRPEKLLAKCITDRQSFKRIPGSLYSLFFFLPLHRFT